jgi:ABC-type lipoprotein export system ATPase subunit
MAMVELKDIRKTYQLGEVDLEVLRGISLAVDAGELVALMGASGSGKSTLMNIIGCLDHPTSGRYWLDGEEVSDLSAKERARVRRRLIGFVFQNFNLLPRTSALENVLMPLTYSADELSEHQMRERAADLLEVAGQPAATPAGRRADRKPRLPHQRGHPPDVRRAQSRRRDHRRRGHSRSRGGPPCPAGDPYP